MEGAIGLGRLAWAARGAKGIGLSSSVAETFRFVNYTEEMLSESKTLYRYFDGVNAGAKGRFLTSSISKFKIIDRMTLALRPSWNAMTNVAAWEVPAGTTVYRGRAAMQFPWIGGKTQYFIKDLSNLTRVY